MRWRVAAPGRLFSPRAIAALVTLTLTTPVVAQTKALQSGRVEGVRFPEGARAIPVSGRMGIAKSVEPLSIPQTSPEHGV